MWFRHKLSHLEPGIWACCAPHENSPAYRYSAQALAVARGVKGMAIFQKDIKHRCHESCEVICAKLLFQDSYGNNLILEQHLLHSQLRELMTSAMGPHPVYLEQMCQVARMILDRHNWFTQVENMPLLNLCSKSAIVGC